MKNNLPKVIFKQMPLELETEMFLDFLDTNWASKIMDEFPEFLKIKSIIDEKGKKEAIEKIIIQIRKELNEKMVTGLKNIKSEWQKVEEEVFKSLSNIIQTDWPEKEITAYISINPICPRFLDSLSFSVSPDNKNPNIIIAHEISHFLYFKKFKEIFPEIGKDKYEFPNKEWILSEIITPIILNDTRMIKILGKGGGFYSEHLKLKVDGKPLTQIIQDLYDKHVLKVNNFVGFIKENMKILRHLI